MTGKDEKDMRASRDQKDMVQNSRIGPEHIS